MVIAEPDITAFKIRNNHDFIFMACDGVFDKLSNKDTVHLVWQTVLTQQNNDPHIQCGKAVDSVLKASALRKSCDNITAVLIAFDNFENLLSPDSAN